LTIFAGPLSFPFSSDNARGFELVGRFAYIWANAVWRKTPFVAMHTLRALGNVTEDEMTHLIHNDWIIPPSVARGGDDDVYRLTGPSRDPRWLMNLAKEWTTYAVEAAGTDTVKIGKALDVEKRLDNLQVASAAELILLGTKRGDHEKRIHDAIAAHRVAGEWFRLDDEVRRILRRERLAR
jgi:hypothetical protein